jgi:hypothetical protein
MSGNYLTTHPVFTLLEKEKDFVARKYALANRRTKKKNKQLIAQCKNTEEKLIIIGDLKNKLKLKMITIMKEIELNNLTFSKKLNNILENLREYYVKLMIEEKKYLNQVGKTDKKQEVVIIDDSITEEVKQEDISDNSDSDSSSGSLEDASR